VKFQPGDLVEYLSPGPLQPARPLFLVVKTRECAGNTMNRFTVLLHNVKTGVQGWDWAHVYGKVE